MPLLQPAEDQEESEKDLNQVKNESLQHLLE